MFPQCDRRLQPRRGAEQPAAPLQRGVPGPHRQDGGQVGGLHRDRRDDAQPGVPAAALHHDQPALGHVDDDGERRHAQRNHHPGRVRTQPGPAQGERRVVFITSIFSFCSLY